MQYITCICSPSFYRMALTRGKRYEVADIDEEKRQVRIRGDNNRIRWFSFYYFDFENKPVAFLKAYCVDDPDTIVDPKDASTEVTFKLSTGEFRWCLFKTPRALEDSGDIVPNTNICFHSSNSHLIIATEITYEVVEEILKELDVENKLIKCSLPLEPDID